MTRPTFVALVSALLLAGPARPARAQQSDAPPSRPYRNDDWAAMEDIKTGSITFAPDGQAVAFVRLRPKTAQAINSMAIEETRADVWLQETPGRPLRNLTQGHADNSGWWWPQWSPDGQRLAMLSSRGGTVTLWAWERATNKVRQVSTEGLDFTEPGGYRWLDAHRLLALAMPEGERAAPLGDLRQTPGRYAQLAMDAWAKAMRGEVTASAVSSLEFAQPQRRLLLLTLPVHGEGPAASTRVIAETQVGYSVFVRNWWPSPDGRAVAVPRPLPERYPGSQRHALGWPAALDLRWLDGRPMELSRPLPSNIATASLRWSPDGKALAFFAFEEAPINPLLLYGEGASEVIVSPEDRAAPLLQHPARLWRVDLEQGRVTPLELGGVTLEPSPEALAAFLDRTGDEYLSSNPLQLPPLEWTVGGELMVRTTRRPSGAGAPDSQWVVLGRDGRTRPGAARLQAAFRADSLAAAAQRQFERRVKPPSPTAEVVAFSAAGQSALYAETNPQGTFLWRATPERPAELLVAANTFLKDVDIGEPKLIEYTTLNGEPVKAYVLLPPGYTPGRRYPLVVDSDIGYENEVIERFHAEAKSGGFGGYVPGQFFAAGGYVYMFTSMPTRATMDRVGRANLLLFTDGVLPAVDKVIQLGYADPDRLFLYGASSMGFGVYGLVTQTPRFKAAVAQCGWSDQIVGPALSYQVARYADWSFDGVRMGASYSYFRLPLWRNADHLRRNSPLSYVDRVQTPLMIVHGDLDVVPMSDPEIFFSALIQQRKPAEFVRYWGEGHTIQNPKNVADWHQRMFAWFDRWGDVSRDARGRLVFEGDRVKSRGGQPALPPEAYARFDAFQPGGAQASERAAR